VDGVSAASVNLADKEATVTYDPNKTNVNAIKAAIVGAGYEA
jgi:copper chaperone CopZ